MVTTAVNHGGIGGPPGSPWRGLRGRCSAWKLHWLLRLGVAMEFIGHGACGIHTKAAWLPFFRLFSIPDSTAWSLMPVVGSMDVGLGLMTLLAPRRALLVYMAVWGCFTALLRPASGDSGWEFLERSYNYGVPLALLMLHGISRNRSQWWMPLSPTTEVSCERLKQMSVALRLVVAFMLVGHGGFGAFMAKANLLEFYRAAGLGSAGLPLETLRSAIGFFEIGLGLAALRITAPLFLMFVFGWKLASELLYPISGASRDCWEVIERGGSYVAPLALLYTARAFEPGSQPKPATVGNDSTARR